MIEREPPRATGQPNAWHAQMSAAPTAELIGWPNEQNECEATPAKSARV